MWIFFASILETSQFEVLLFNVGAMLHTLVIDGGSEAMEADLISIESVVRTPLRAIAPGFESLIPADFFESVTIVEEGKIPDASPYVAVAEVLTIAAAVVAFALGILVVSLSQPKWVSLVVIGMAVTASALVTSWLVPGGRSLTIGLAEDPDVEVLIANLFDALAVSLRSQSRLVASGGIAIVTFGVALGVLGRRRDDRTA